MKQQQKIALKGQTYATPKTESVEILHQCILCGSNVMKKGNSTESVVTLGFDFP